MKLAGIVCEYNPFHTGHLHHINETKRLTGCDGVVAVMSGNFVQRGEAAIFDKEKRAAAAVMCGADVVLELGALHAVQTAELFALNSVKILSSIPEVEFLSFGAETDNISLIKKCAEMLSFEDTDFKKELKKLLKTGLSYPTARGKALELTDNSACAELLSSPNNILAVEYIKALIKLDSGITPIAVKRIGAEHDSESGEDGFLSASAIRQLLKNSEEISDVIPDAASVIYKEAEIFDHAQFNRAVLSNIIKMPTDELKNISGVSEGLENRIKKAALSAQSLSELCDSVKTKRYTYSALRRVLLSSYLGICEADRFSAPSYIKILDFSERGREILNVIKKTSSLPVIKNMKALKALKNADAIRAYERENQLDLIYRLYKKSGGRV